jgi:hypothetical protein
MAQALFTGSHPASAITLKNFVQIAFNGSSGNAIETLAQGVCRVPGTWSNLSVRFDANGTARSVIFRKNADNGNQVVSPADSTATTTTDITHTDTLAAGDKWSILYSGTAPAYTAYVTTMIFQATSGHACYYSSNSLSLSGSPAFFLPGGSVSSSSFATEANLKFRIRAAGTLTNAFALATVSDPAAQTMVSRINGVTGNISISIAGGGTGIFEDTTHTDTLAVGNDLGFQITGNTGSGIIAVGSAIQSNSITNDILSAATNGVINSGTVFYCIAGSASARATVTDSQLAHGFDGSCTNMRTFLSQNSYNNTTTVTFQKNTVNGNQVFTIAAAATGLFEDTTHTDTFLAADLVNYKTAGSTSGTITQWWWGLTEGPSTTALVGGMRGANQGRSAPPSGNTRLSAREFGSLFSKPVPGGLFGISGTSKSILPSQSAMGRTSVVQAATQSASFARSNAPTGTVRIQARGLSASFVRVNQSLFARISAIIRSQVSGIDIFAKLMLMTTRALGRASGSGSQFGRAGLSSVAAPLVSGTGVFSQFFLMTARVLGRASGSGFRFGRVGLSSVAAPRASGYGFRFGRVGLSSVAALRVSGTVATSLVARLIGSVSTAVKLSAILSINSFRQLVGHTIGAAAGRLGVPVSSAVLRGMRGVSGLVGRLFRFFLPTLVPDPRFISVSSRAAVRGPLIPSRTLTITAVPRLGPSPRNSSMPYGNDLSPVDPTVERVTITFDFSPWLAPGVTISSISSLVAANAARTINQDPNPQNIIIAGGGAQIGAAPGKPANTAVLQQVTQCQANVTYLLQCLVATSDSQAMNLATHLPCNSLN